MKYSSIYFEHTTEIHGEEKTQPGWLGVMN